MATKGYCKYCGAFTFAKDEVCQGCRPFLHLLEPKVIEIPAEITNKIKIYDVLDLAELMDEPKDPWSDLGYPPRRRKN